MRIPTVLALSILSGCAPQSDPAEERMEPGTSQDAALDSVAALLSETIRRVDDFAEGADRILSPLPVLTPGEEAELRRHLNATHVARARALGVRADDRAALDALLQEGRLIELEDSTEHWIVRPRTAPAHVVPHTRELLRVLGERFQERLAAAGLPPYRLEVTSALRTTDRQAALTRSNANAAALSSHEFGTTVDISYAAYAPPAEFPEDLLADVPDALGPIAARFAQLALESVSARKSRELSQILGRVLMEAQAEGLVLVIYERQQTVFHLTVGRALAGSEEEE